MSFWAGKKVLVIGHTGFKGAWLSVLLNRMGAKVHGYALPPESDDDLWNAAQEVVQSNTYADILDADRLQQTIVRVEPEIIFHFAAQSLVRRAYADPAGTFAVNVQGTVNVLDAARASSTLRALVVATTDKCYANQEWHWKYRETDTLGGHEPYGASKACTELVVTAMRESYLQAQGVGVSTVRAGNVIGGGDWSEDRLIPDLVRGARAGETVRIRHPEAIRPWQHVLDALSAYVLLAEKLHENPAGTAVGAWNVGPQDNLALTVRNLVEGLQTAWASPITVQYDALQADEPRESTRLELDSSAFAQQFHWQPRLNQQEAILWASQWYANNHQGQSPLALCHEQIDAWTNR